MARIIPWLRDLVFMIWQSFHLLTLDDAELERVGEKYGL